MYRQFWPACWLIGLLAASFPALADEPSDDVLPGRLMNDQAIAVVRVDLAEVTPEQLALPLIVGNLAAQHVIKESPAVLVERARRLSQAGAKYAYLVLLAPSGIGYFQVLYVVPADNDKRGQEAEQTLRSFLPAPQTGTWRVEKSRGAVIAGPTELVAAALAAGDATRPGLAEALAAAGDAPLAFAIVPSADQRRVLQELLPLALPGGEHLRPGLSSFTWISIAFVEKPRRSLTVISQHSSDTQAAEAAQSLAAWLAQPESALPADPGLVGIQSLFKLLEPRANGSQVVIELTGDRLAAVDAMLKQALVSVNQAVERSKTINRLKQFGLALLTQESIKAGLPDAASRDAQDRPLLSWRVHALPYLEQNELYKQFHLDEPWDSEHNRKLIPLMPEVYQVGSEANVAAGKTCLLLPVGDATLFPGGRGVKLKEIRDGASNTIMVVEVDDDRAVAWTRPDDLNFDEANPLAGLGGHFGDGFLALMADGSVHFIENTVDPASVKGLFTRAGRDPVRLD